MFQFKKKAPFQKPESNGRPLKSDGYVIKGRPDIARCSVKIVGNERRDILTYICVATHLTPGNASSLILNSILDWAKSNGPDETINELRAILKKDTNPHIAKLLK